MIYNFDGLSFQILTIDRFFHKKGIFDVKARPYAAFSYRVSGKGMFEIGGKRLQSSPGDVLFLPADTPYRVEYLGGESIVVHFSECNYLEAETVFFEQSETMALRFQQLLEVWNERHSVNQAKSIVYDILEKMANDQKNAMEHTAFADCVRYIDAHFCDPSLTVKRVCDVGFISASGLQRAFGEHFGISPKQYLNKLRMNRALELLMENALSVKEIAFACGFSDEKYFSRSFKRKYGYPPSHFFKKAHA